MWRHNEKYCGKKFLYPLLKPRYRKKAKKGVDDLTKRAQRNIIILKDL
jgi:hypothetical protein